MNDKLLESRGRAPRGVRYKDDADIADYLEVIRAEDEERFLNFLTRLPIALRAQTVIELPGAFQADLVKKLDPEGLREIIAALETDDAADFTQLAMEVDREKAEAVFEQLDDHRQRALRQLLVYDEEQAGSLMQIEVFSARDHETIQNSLRRLRRLKSQGAIEGVQDVMVVDDHNRLLKVIPLAELILIAPRKRYAEFIDDYPPPTSVLSNAPIDDAIRAIERYDLPILPVVDRFGHLLGQITHDDAMDVVQQRATEQMYGLGQVSTEEDPHAGVIRVGRGRAFWLALNLVNVTIVSIVIGLFEEALQAVVALAVLMPVVANMAGTTAIQTLTVVVRQIALGELTRQNGVAVLRKEIAISTLNGLLFGVLAMIISYLRFESITLGAVMAASIAISFVAAGVLGVVVPLALKRLGSDPAISSSTLVITAMDIIGFFSFLALATLFVL